MIENMHESSDTIEPQQTLSKRAIKHARKIDIMYNSKIRAAKIKSKTDATSSIKT